MSENDKSDDTETAQPAEKVRAPQRRNFLTGALAGAAAVTAGTVNISCGNKADADSDGRLPRSTKLSDMDDFFSASELSMLTAEAKALTLGQLDEQLLFHADDPDGVNHFDAAGIIEQDYRSIEMAFANANQRHVQNAVARNGLGVGFASQAHADTSVSVCCCCCPCCSCCYAASPPPAVQTM